MGRSPCCDKNDVKKGPWTAEEDNKLTQYIQIHGPGNWRTLPKNAGLQRCGKSCRLRWTNYLKPDIKRGRFTFEEEETIIQLHSVLGNKWSAIAARLPGRTDNEIKNYWNTHIRKRLLRKGIDPITHAPRLDILDLSSLLNSPQFNISNLFLLQTLLNPEALRLALNLLSSQNQNPDILLQEFQQSQLLNSNNQFQSQAPFVQPNQFDNIINQQIPSSNITSPFENETQFMQGNMEQFLMNPTNSNCQIFQDNLLPNANIRQNFCYGDLSDDSSFKSLNSNSNSQNLSFDSVLSTPISSPNNLDSASGLYNGGTEDEIESFCSNLLKIEIPEGLDFDDFM